MGNHQNPKIDQDKHDFSQYTLKQYSYMLSAITRQNKLIQNNQQHKVIGANAPPNNTHGMKDSLTVDECNNPLGPLNNQSAVKIQEPSQTHNDEELSIRATHIDLLTKRFQMKEKQQKTLSGINSDLRKSQRNVQRERSELKPKDVGQRDRQKEYRRSESNPNFPLNPILTQHNEHQTNIDNKTSSQYPPTMSALSKQPTYLKVPSKIDDLDTLQLNQSNCGEYLRNPIVGSQHSTMQIDNQTFEKRRYFIVTDTTKGEKEQDINDKPFFLTSWLSDVFNSGKLKNDSQTPPLKTPNCNCNIAMPILTIFSPSQSNKSTQNPQQGKQPNVQQYYIEREFQLPQYKTVADRKKNDKKNVTEKQIKGVSKTY